ncbi:MAG: BatA and WFA domain-containing protein [Verrucomicrobiota bacterium]
MQFLYPNLLWLLLLGLIPVVLYLFRRRSKQVEVSTLVFFKSLAQEHQESAWLRRLKKILSFLLTLIVIGLVILSLARLVEIRSGDDQLRSVVILLDRSASMAMTDQEGESRLDVAKQRIREQLVTLPEGIELELLVYDRRPELLQPRTTKRRKILSQLDSVAVRPITGRPDRALNMAKTLAELALPAAIWHFSDEVESAEADLVDGIALQHFATSIEEATNVGITAFDLRPIPLEYGRYEVYVEAALNNAATEPVTTKLLVSIAGNRSHYQEIDLNPGQRSAVTFEVSGSIDQVMEIELQSQADRFGWDDRVTVPLPEPRSVVVAWIREDDGEDPFTRLALTSIQETGRLELLRGAPEAWPLSESVDAVIFDGWLPEEWPGDLPAIVLNPPGSVGPIIAQQLSDAVPHDSIRAIEPDHPVLFRVNTSRLALTQTAILDPRGSLDPLWMVGNEPVLAAGEVDGQRLVVMGFSAGRSDRLPLTASYPLLIGNAVLWAVEEVAAGRKAALLRTGEILKIESDTIRWRQWDGREVREQVVPVPSSRVELDRVGIWETEQGRFGGAHLLSVAESDIPVLPSGSDVASVETRSNWQRFVGHLIWWLLGVGVILLLLESWLFHRHAVY